MLKRKQYHIAEEHPSVGDIFQTRVGSRLRPLRFVSQQRGEVILTDGRRAYRRRPDQVRPVRIDRRLLRRLGFTESPGRLVLDRRGLHFEAYERADTMHIEITPAGNGRKTLVCCDFVHELQHLKRLQIAGIRLPFTLSDLQA